MENQVKFILEHSLIPSLAYFAELTGLRSTEERLKRNESRANCQRWRPLIFQDIKADSASLRADIWVPDLGVKLHLHSQIWLRDYSKWSLSQKKPA